MKKDFLPTLVLRHRKENLKKCSLRGLEERKDFFFLTYPKDRPQSIEKYCLLDLKGECLTEQDSQFGLLVIDASWRKKEKIFRSVGEIQEIPCRSLPICWRTAYPRRQEDCLFPERGLASLEAIFAAYLILGRDVKGLLDHYHWKDQFLEKNSEEIGLLASK